MSNVLIDAQGNIIQQTTEGVLEVAADNQCTQSLALSVGEIENLLDVTPPILSPGKCIRIDVDLKQFNDIKNTIQMKKIYMILMWFFVVITIIMSGYAFFLSKHIEKITASQQIEPQ